MSIKPLPKSPRLPTSISGSAADFIKALYSQLTDMLETINRLVNAANNETWQTPILAGSWTNYGEDAPPAGYYKDGQGAVHLRGIVKGGSGTIFTLPFGYRPGYKHSTASLANSIACLIQVAPDGTVAWQSGGTNAWVSLDNISFRVD
jgi:hypothetical protein